jgi:prepilin peptidase CpaA
VPTSVADVRVVLLILFTGLLALGAGWDLSRRRIPNQLVIALFAAGIVVVAVSSGVRGVLTVGVAGAMTGLVVWLPLWLMGFIGAGDVKFFVAAAVWLGPRATLGAALVSAIAGGILACVWLAIRMRKNSGQRTTVPYGVAMAVGFAVVTWVPIVMR